jgi:hypothetical protein
MMRQRSSSSWSTLRERGLDPAGFVTAVPNWTVGETFSIGSGESFRIIEIETEIDEELLEQGSTACSPSSLAEAPRVSHQPTSSCTTASKVRSALSNFLMLSLASQNCCFSVSLA